MTESELKRSEELLNQIKSIMKSRNPVKDVNLFSILGMETKEVSAHSAFLFYVFEPFADSEGEINTTNLRCLYEYLRSKKTDLPNNPDNINIYREVQSEYGRMDFLIRFNTKTKSDAIVIELKIKADEQEDQIKRYREYLKENDYTEDNIFFLTPDGRPSLTGESTPISLKDLCNCVLKRIAKEWSGDYMTIINQYNSIIKKINGGTNDMEVKDVLKSKNDILVIDKLYKEKDKVLTKLLECFMRSLRDGINEAITKNDLPIELKRDCDDSDLSNYYIKGTKTFPSLVYSINNPQLEKRFNESFKNNYLTIESEKNSNIYFFIEIEWKLYCGFTLRSCGNNDTYDLVKVKPKQSIKNSNNVHLFESGWLSWEYITCDGKKIDFTEYDNLESFLELIEQQSLEFDKNKINIIVDQISQSFVKQWNLLLEKMAK